MKKILLLAVLALAWSSTSSAQSVAELRWRPYLGCWQLFQENVSVKGLPASPGTTVCVAPSESGVRLTTYVDGKQVLEQQMVADAATRAIQDGACPAAQTMEWSHDGARLFTQTSVRCAGQPPRTTSSIALMTQGGVWFDVQSIGEGDSQRVRIRRYQRTTIPPAGATVLSDAMLALAASESQAASAHTLSIDDVIEASAKTSPAAVEAMVAEVGGRFNISSRTLAQLADAGVSRQAIDLMVAKAFPERFREDRRETYSTGSSSADYGSGAMYVGGDVILGSRPYPFPLYQDPFYYYYSPYFFSPYYYSLFAYPYYPHRYSNYSTYYYGGPGISPIVPPIGPDLPPGQHGFIVNGRGYTREGGSISGQPQGSSGQRTITSPRGVRSRGSSNSPSSGADSSSSSPSGSSGSSSSGSSSGGGSISGSGYSGGGDGGGRTAQPR